MHLRYWDQNKKSPHLFQPLHVSYFPEFSNPLVYKDPTFYLGPKSKLQISGPSQTGSEAPQSVNSGSVE